jgi:RNA 3'-terminal phosphate cyclase (ATP)
MPVIDGAYGEGGGQILRTSLTLAAILTQPIRIENIRAKRKNPGLAAQHLTAVRAAAMICDASLSGDQLESTQLIFEPQSPPIPGLYEFDVAEARLGGSAGAATLVLQTVLLPLALAGGPSTITVKGGTHVAWSPSFFYLRDIYLPMVGRLGVEATAELLAWGWYPAGEGEIKVETPGRTHADRGASPGASLQGSAEAAGKQWLERGALKQITGVGIASSLPAHIAQRMGDRATKLLKKAGVPATIKPRRVRSTSPGAGMFLTAEYETSRAGFGALGRKGKPAEQVAEEAVEALLAFHQSGAVFDVHLTDQLILPMVLAGCSGTFSSERLSQHTLTNIWVVEQFLGSVVKINRKDNTLQLLNRP